MPNMYWVDIVTQLGIYYQPFLKIQIGTSTILNAICISAYRIISSKRVKALCCASWNWLELAKKKRNMQFATFNSHIILHEVFCPITRVCSGPSFQWLTLPRDSHGPINHSIDTGYSVGPGPRVTQCSRIRFGQRCRTLIYVGNNCALFHSWIYHWESVFTKFTGRKRSIIPLPQKT